MGGKTVLMARHFLLVSVQKKPLRDSRTRLLRHSIGYGEVFWTTSGHFLSDKRPILNNS